MSDQSTAQPEAAVETVAPEKSKPAPKLTAADKAWIRDEMHLAVAGISREQREEQNP
jgi:hypothetical protein